MAGLPLTADEFIAQLEGVNREKFDDPEWSFNNAQERAIRHGDGPLHVTAGPGSGKTEVLVCRALKLLLVDEVQPQSILLTTFTEKAAQNLEERIVDRLSRLGYQDAIDANEIRIGTLHSLSRDIMQEYRYEDYANVELLDEDAQQLFMYDNCEFVSVLREDGNADEWETVSEEEIDDVWRFFGELRGWRENFPPNKWEATELAAKLFNRVSQYRADTAALRTADEPAWRVCAEGLDRYRETLRDNSRCDFARLLERFIEFVDSEAGRRFVEGEPDRDRPPLEHVLVDEYQDTNPLQQELYFRLVEELDSPNITVVGDDDQALYRFRGGTVECLIQFPERSRQRFDTPVEEVQLRTNYRSTDDVVSWCNRYVGDYPLMQEPGARAPGKEPMLVDRTDTDDQTSVRALLAQDTDTAAERAAELVDQLHDEGYIEDYSQVAFLFKSTKESDEWAGQYVEALRERDIPVHNPRNKAFLERPEIQFALGSVIRVIDPDFEGASVPWVSLQGGVEDQVHEWADQFDEYVEEYEAWALEEFVQQKQRELEQAADGESLGYTILELLYQVLSFDPFYEWIEGAERPDRGQRLGRLTNLFDAFLSVTGPGYLEKSGNASAVSTSFLGSFYWTFCGYLQSQDFDEPEDPHDQLPAGFVQVMTTHQAKGLEFPVVFVDDLDTDPWTSGTYWLEEQLEPYADIQPIGDVDSRAERDEIRRFYVSYSRAEENLFLLGREGKTSDLSLGYDASGEALDETWFSGDRSVETPEDFLESTEGDVGPLDEVDLKRRYSITGDVLSYRRCKRQYGYYNELGFTPNHVTQLFFGRVVHETLDRAHRHYAGDFEDVEGGERPSSNELREYFDEVAEALKARNIYPMSKEAEETAFEYIEDFNEEEGDWLYPRVVDTEHPLQSDHEDFVLEGVVDVLTSDDDGDEIWDYKAGQRPDGNDDLEDYEAQLYTYAELYRYQNDEYPDRGVIYFLGEDQRDDAVFEVDFRDEDIEGSIEEFEETVGQIKDDREDGDWFDISENDRPSEGTCAECDVRWSCPARPEYSLEKDE
ncbi:ATP-dependent helicase [Halomicrobium salinisoli]|uniref:ATP-dependent helicase n=1 Tax=Halomicrobium salinisoli TaxID=2878391 RepID=UPI001CF03110|nr:ATP-dependent DNA helicase [Halomicrobium salinisoli]